MTGSGDEEPLKPSGIEPNLAKLRTIKETELQKGNRRRAAPSTTIYRPHAIHFEIDCNKGELCLSSCNVKQFKSRKISPRGKNKKDNGYSDHEGPQILCLPSLSVGKEGFLHREERRGARVGWRGITKQTD